MCYIVTIPPQRKIFTPAIKAEKAVYTQPFILMNSQFCCVRIDIWGKMTLSRAVALSNDLR